MAANRGGSGGGGDEEKLVAEELSKTLKEGERILAPTRRPDGTLRKPIRIRAGYVPQEEVAIYQSKGALWKKEMASLQELPPGSDPAMNAKPKTKSVKRNERKKEKRLQAALEKGKNIDPQEGGEIKKEDVLSTEDGNHGLDSFESMESQMSKLSVSTDLSIVTGSSNATEDLNRRDPILDIDKKIRALRKKGKAGTKPTTEELAAALESHDLFIYFGHGSGSQYIPGKEIQKLENCAATLLMGCSSGSLSVSGCYPPRGTPLHYLVAGSPVIVANLWEVTDKDIDRFAKAMLDAWMMERSNRSADCTKCDSVTKSMESLNMNGSGGERTRTQKLIELSDSIECVCDHRPKVGSFMSQSRESCVLRFLIGASPVCYGVPTGIWIKDS